MLFLKRLGLLTLLLFLYPAIGIAREVTLAWDTNTDDNLAGYRLYARERGEAYDYRYPEWQGATNQCTVTGFDEYESYYFVVRAYDNDGNESGNSNEVYLASVLGDDSNSNSLDNDGGSSGGGGGGGGGCFISSLSGQ